MLARLGRNKRLRRVAVCVRRCGNLREKRTCPRCDNAHLRLNYSVALVDFSDNLGKRRVIFADVRLDRRKRLEMLVVFDRRLCGREFVRKRCSLIRVVAKFILAVADQKALHGKPHARKIDFSPLKDSDLRHS